MTMDPNPTHGPGDTTPEAARRAVDAAQETTPAETSELVRRLNEEAR